MKLQQTFIYQGIKYRIMSIRQPSRYETGRTYELLRYGVGLDKAYADDWLVLHEKDINGGCNSAVERDLVIQMPNAEVRALPPTATIIDWPFGEVRA